MNDLDLAEKYLDRFKKRMKIFGTSEDDYLTADILAPSFARIRQLIGGENLEEEINFLELVFERGRYAYNDQLEYFEPNFQSFFMDYSLEVMPIDSEVATDDDSSGL